MQITISGKNFDVGNSLKERVQEKLNKLGNRFDNIVSANVTMSTDRNRHIVEITLFGKNMEFRAEEREMSDMYASINSAVGKLEKQLSRSREKNVDKTRQSREAVPAMVEEAPERETDERAVKLVSEKSYHAEPMSLEEAVKHLEENGYAFYAFHNMENGRINVVYNSERGLALIDPKI
ncbi:MAG: ribosome-associated translation inhibitor RaiA [bacterium]|nr:ribosome-associated translation inhibitor RaiA [bacterium]